MIRCEACGTEIDEDGREMVDGRQHTMGGCIEYLRGAIESYRKECTVLRADNARLRAALERVVALRDDAMTLRAEYRAGHIDDIGKAARTALDAKEGE